MVRIVRVGALSSTVALLVTSVPISVAHAQAGAGQTTAVGATTNTRATDDREDDDGFDPGWFGLLGLAGLFGLRRNRDEVTRVDATPVTQRP